MKVEKLPVDDLTFRLNVTIEKADALEKRKKALNNYRRTAEIKGFRKGMAPLSYREDAWHVCSDRCCKRPYIGTT